VRKGVGASWHFKQVEVLNLKNGAKVCVCVSVLRCLWLHGVCWKGHVRCFCRPLV